MALSEPPKYQSISNDLRSRISAGEFSPGERLPAQQTMAADYDVTVMTLRHALAELESEGLVHASKGKGTFVSEARSVRLGIDHLWSFAEEMQNQGVEISTEVLAIRFDSGPDEVERARSALNLDDEAAVVEIVRRRSIDESPVVLQRSYLSAAAWQRVAHADLSAASLYEVLNESVGFVLARASETFGAVGLTEEDGRLLDSEGGIPALESIRTSFDQRDSPFLYDHALMLGSATEIHAERTPDSMRLAYGSR